MKFHTAMAPTAPPPNVFKYFCSFVFIFKITTKFPALNINVSGSKIFKLALFLQSYPKEWL